MSKLLGILIFLWVIMSCTFDTENSVNKPIELNIIRFDRILDTLDSNEKLNRRCSFIPEFCTLYFQEIVPLSTGGPLEKLSMDTLQKFRTDPFISHLLDTTRIVFPDMDFFEQGMEDALQNMNAHFDMDSIFNVYCFVSGMAYQRFLFTENGRDAIGIGLDLFLGSDYPYHLVSPTNPSFSEYINRTYNKDHMVKKAIELLVDDKLLPLNDQRLLDLMVQNGIKLYILEKVLPGTPDTVIYEYKESQMEWCRKNEMGIWSFFLDKELLYDRDMRKISKYVLPGPDAPGMPAEAPGQTANYIGKNIVSQYMKRHPDTKFNELIGMGQRAQELLEMSKYKPHRE